MVRNFNKFYKNKFKGKKRIYSKSMDDGSRSSRNRDIYCYTCGRPEHFALDRFVPPRRKEYSPRRKRAYKKNSKETVERAFSTMDNNKTELRSKMSGGRRNDFQKERALPLPGSSRRH